MEVILAARSAHSAHRAAHAAHVQMDVHGAVLAAPHAARALQSNAIL